MMTVGRWEEEEIVKDLTQRVRDLRFIVGNERLRLRNSEIADLFLVSYTALDRLKERLGCYHDKAFGDLWGNL